MEYFDRDRKGVDSVKEISLSLSRSLKKITKNLYLNK